MHRAPFWLWPKTLRGYEIILFNSLNFQWNINFPVCPTRPLRSGPLHISNLISYSVFSQSPCSGHTSSCHVFVYTVFSAKISLTPSRFTWQMHIYSSSFSYMFTSSLKPLFFPPQIALATHHTLPHSADEQTVARRREAARPGPRS